MKKITALILVLTAGFALGHEGVELGPNKGRILEFSKNETMHGEVIVKDGKMHIALLDKDMKPVKIEAQSLTATSGTRAEPVKMQVEKTDAGFVVDAPPAGQWIIMQYKESEDAKPITARMKYDTTICDGCKNVEWLCTCE